MRNRNFAFGAFALAVVAAVMGQWEALLAAPILFGVVSETTDLDEGMKVIFEDAITENFITDTEFLDIFEQDMNVKTDETTGGRYIETAQLFALPTGVGARAEGEALPIPQGPTIVNSRVNLKKVVASLSMTGDVMDVVRSSEGAFLNYAEKAMPYVAEVVQHELDRMLLAYGAGIKARVNEATPNGDATLAVDSAMGIADYSSGAAVLQFTEGETLRASPNADGSSPRAETIRVTGTDYDNESLLLEAAPTTFADDDFLFAGDSSTVSSQTAAGVNREIMGIHGMVDDGGILQTFQNIDRDVYLRWRGIISSTSGVLTEDKLIVADDKCFVEGKGTPTVIVMSRRSSRQYWADLKGDRVINDPRGNYEGGLNRKGLKIHLGDRVATLRVARKMPDEVIFGLSPETLKRFHNVGFKWDDRTGSVWNRVSANGAYLDAFLATGYIRLETACSAPHKNFRLDGLDAS